MPTYIPDIPQGTQQINNTTKGIQENFQYINDLIAVNHVGFNTPDIFGNHTQVNYVQQTVDPVTGPAEIALYSKPSTTANGIELFYRYPNNGVVNQLTGSDQDSGNAGATGGGYFNINDSSLLNTLPNYGFGYLISGHWQYLSNGTLIISGITNNYYTTTKPTSPYTITIPSGIKDLNGKTIPSFTQTPFNVQVSTAQAQFGTACNYAVTITSKTTAQCYYSGTFGTAPTSIYSINAMFIGV